MRVPEADIGPAPAAQSQAVLSGAVTVGDELVFLVDVDAVGGAVE